MPAVPLPTTVLPGATELAAAPAARRHRWRRLTVHYVEMVVAMAVGMVVLHPVWTFALGAAGWSAFLDSPEAMAMVMATDMTIGMTAWMRFRGHGWRPCAEMVVMATDMTIGMSAWMRFRGHGWRPCAEMGAAMYLPFLVLFPPMWAGWMSSDGMLLWGHVLMLFAMAGAMAVRPQEYVHC